MIQVKSFKISDDAGINALLKQYRLAQGASVFLSDGELCIPFEDGEPENSAQKIISLKEQKNQMLGQIEIVEHSQHVLEFLKKDAVVRMEEAKANLAEANAKKGKEKYNDVKEKEQRVKEGEGAIRQLNDQYRQNEHEVMRLTLNIAMFDERIAELSA